MISHIADNFEYVVILWAGTFRILKGFILLKYAIKK